MAIAIEGAAIVVTRSGVLTDQDILIENGRVVAINPAGESETPSESRMSVHRRDPGAGERDGSRSGTHPEEMRVIDGSRRAVVAGWKNAHTHAAMTLLRGYGDDMRLQPWLEERIWPAEGRLTPEDVYWGTRLATVEMIRSGTTFANDMYFHVPESRRAFVESGMRAAIGLAMFDFGDPDRRRREMAAVDALLEAYPPSLRSGSDSNGTISDPERVFFAIAPHSIYTCSAELLRWAAERAEEIGLPFHIHMSETQQEVADCVALHGMRPFEWLDSLGVLDRVGPRTLAAHGVWLDERERRIVADHGVTIAHNPASNMKLASGVLDWQGLREAGVPLMLAPDGVASNNNLDMFDEMKLAALLQKVSTGDPTRLGASEAVALAAGELGSAFRSFGVGGHIAVGEPADLALLDLDDPQMVPLHNVMSNIAYAANGSVVDTVIAGGEVLMEGRVIPGEQEVLREARRSAARLVRLD
jgi:5-methylthioadenosine/S-adenosylhomocysteine deaminase